MLARILSIGLVVALGVSPAPAQLTGDRQDSLADPIPPPMPKRKAPDNAPEYRGVIDDSDLPWTIPKQLLESLAARTTAYVDYARQFVCNEEVRRADYGADGDVSKEKVQRYAYTLLQDELGHSLREYRQELKNNGEIKKGEVIDDEPFPPAYAWVYLFSNRNQPLFSYRHVSQHFEGFDLVHEIQFKGGLPFTDGRDIRQWEGTVLVDAISLTPIEVLAEPSGQRERIRQLYRSYNQSFNVLGFRTKPKPLGYRAEVEFTHRRQKLRFPTHLRYDTHRAVSAKQISRVKASTRSYTHYRFIDVETDPEVGDVVEP